jgi:hypothetical protein
MPMSIIIDWMNTFPIASSQSIVSFSSMIGGGSGGMSNRSVMPTGRQHLRSIA